ncbi:phosphoribosylformylglycinamidine synthase-like isoform X4 [Catharus ustulatus]|nr:phosphoribosylformylglycinamidine synthase-like isoform X4 [Catharus ustulatus]
MGCARQRGLEQPGTADLCDGDGEGSDGQPDPVPGEMHVPTGLAGAVALERNLSGRFESRFVTVRVEPGPALMLRGMEGVRLGVWVAHGEGWFQFRPPSLLTRSVQSGLAALRYVDDCGVPTECYPMNPNGSSRGVTALVTCGQHLVAMPHPKWSVRAWQCPWAGRSAATAGRSKAGHRPWLRMFQNAMEWCLQWSEGEKRPLSDQ